MRRFLGTILLLVAAVALLPPLAARLFHWGPDASLLPPHARTVSLADGRSIHYVPVGDPAGVPVVLIHGLPSNAADWADLPHVLAEKGPYRVIAYDRIGYGYSSRAEAKSGGFTYGSNATELRELLDALEIQQAVLVGWSYGGGVAMTFAQRFPERVSHLVLIGSVSPHVAQDQRQSLVDRIVGSRAGVAILDWVASVPPLSRALTRSALIDAFARPEAIPDGWVDYTRAVLALPGTIEAFVAESQRADESGLHPEQIQTPALVIHGADDYLVPYPVGEELHRQLSGSKFVAVLSGSHMLPVTHADLLADAIDDFVGAY